MKEDDFITEVKTKFREGMKKYYTYVVQYKDSMEMKSYQDKLDNEVKQYPKKIRRIKQLQQDYKAIFS